MLMDHLCRMGQREIAKSYRACLRILLAAGGAGFITAGTVIFKHVILHSSLSWLTCGILAALNFVASFLFMQLLGFRLATKQSSLLGAALARTERFRDELVWSFRTQSFSAFGNLAFVIPAIFAFHLIYLKFSGAPFLDPEAARSLLESLHPWKGGTLVYAALTGCILWWCTLFGAALANWLRPFSKTVASVGFNIILGFVLAFTPLLGRWLHIPLDVRHFTLSTGAAAIAVASLGFREALHAGLLPAALGVLCIGLLNFGVSAALAYAAASIRIRKAATLQGAQS